MKKLPLPFYLFMLVVCLPCTVDAQDGPLRLGVAGLSHGHIAEVEKRVGRGDFIVVGIAEKDAGLLESNSLARSSDPSILFSDISEMVAETRPEAVIAFGSVYDHMEVVESCAPLGIDVMVEKPLAVNMKHARRMAALAREYGILLLTNYETTWYDTNHDVKKIVDEGGIGDIIRMNIFDGHNGPVGIGCGPEFVDWLTDPVLNGGGAVVDFGCYGANLATWLMNGKKPVSVFAVLKQQKPEIYPDVDDDATIMLEYPTATAQVMASWNWPFGRKDMHVYGTKGYVCQDTPTRMRVSGSGRNDARAAPALQTPYNDPFLYLKAAVRREIEVSPDDLSSLENNLIVVEILDAARKSAKTGKAVKLK